MQNNNQQQTPQNTVINGPEDINKNLSTFPDDNTERGSLLDQIGIEEEKPKNQPAQNDQAKQ